MVKGKGEFRDMIVRYNPAKHADMQILEYQSHEEDGMIVTEIVKSDATREQAAQTPWFYCVRTSDIRVRVNSSEQ